MKKNPKLELRRKRISPEVKALIDKSFAISEQIDIILKQKGLTQKQLAKMLEKSESEISKWMSGIHNFTMSTIVKLELALSEQIIICPKDAKAEYTFIITSLSNSAVAINANNINDWDSLISGNSMNLILGEQNFKVTIPENYKPLLN